MNQSTSAHSAPSLLGATARATALILGASLGLVGLLCGAMVVASATLDAKPASAGAPATTAPTGDAPAPGALPSPRGESAKKPRSSI